MTLGEKIREYRKFNHYSQEKVAELMEVSRQAVTKWESNQSAPSTENLIKLADLFHISLDNLVTPVQISDDSSAIPAGAQKVNHKRRNSIILGTFILICIIVLVPLLIRMLFGTNSDSIQWSSSLLIAVFYIINLSVLVGIVAGAIYLFILLVRALKKYINSSGNR